MSSALHAVLSGGGRVVATAGARALLQIPTIPGDVSDSPQDATPQSPITDGLDSLPALDSGDAAWMMTSTALVLMMAIPGLSLFYGGLVRPKNVLNVVSSASSKHLSIPSRLRAKVFGFPRVYLFILYYYFTYIYVVLHIKSNTTNAFFFEQQRCSAI